MPPRRNKGVAATRLQCGGDLLAFQQDQVGRSNPGRFHTSLLTFRFASHHIRPATRWTVRLVLDGADSVC